MYATDLEVLEFVDNNDEVIGKASRWEIHSRGLKHRAVHIFLFNPSGDIFVQRRSERKDHYPLKLDSSAAGHVDPGESYKEAAKRELQEELGISAHLNMVFKIPASEITDNEFVTLYNAFSSVSITPYTDEIVWGGFMNPAEISQAMIQNCEDFVPAFIFLWNKYLSGRP